eukprot:gnl/TRDRNA2_/TRDRNA2_151689_c0_seq1.p1 gnl/TRDRNA2_/TRDRNA2_151689_c0~~gnl/TRDRNA2_/TRDRNA2_151689_c0_seq1.p1  ORF type:complete len:517 (+),score=56.51 gnl/TRDRNA2_/TRDRNA2_151689_c0_seq1:213-1763(+)
MRASSELLAMPTLTWTFSGLVWRIVCPFLARMPPAQGEEDLSHLRPGWSWRMVRPGGDLPVGAEVEVTRELRALGGEFTGTGLIHSPSGKAMEVEHIRDDDLEFFLSDKPIGFLRRPRPWIAGDICKRGRFLINDPRLGGLHNQRISYETALAVAETLGRTLVIPGFFKFPHPNEFNGWEWVSASELFEWSELEKCYSNVIEMSTLLDVCGHEILDRHVTIGFKPPWMTSSEPPPWSNSTRTELKWAPVYPHPDFPVRLRTRRTKEWELKLNEPFWYLLRPFLASGVAAAQTIRVHGLLEPDISIRGVTNERPLCFVPSQSIMMAARTSIDQWMRVPVKGGGDEPGSVLGLHLRIFKHSPNTSGGWLGAEVISWTCNLHPDTLMSFVAFVLLRSFGGFRPSHTYVATNERNGTTIAQYVEGFPGPRRNTYTVELYEQAVTALECVYALQSVLVDAAICAYAKFFIGNGCSTMSEYIRLLRYYLGHDFDSTVIIGGRNQEDIFESWKQVDLSGAYFS